VLGAVRVYELEHLLSTQVCDREGVPIIERALLEHGHDLGRARHAPQNVAQVVLDRCPCRRREQLPHHAGNAADGLCHGVTRDDPRDRAHRPQGKKQQPDV
jgi:hypothetical protein